MLDELSKLKAKRFPNKINAHKIIYNSIEYDSKREANLAKKLDELKITFEHQVEVTLQEAFELEDEKIQPIKIVVDFLVDGEIFCDVKGHLLQPFL